MSDEFDFDAPDVIAVREDDEKRHELIDQGFRLSIRYSESASVLFRLHHSSNASTNTMIYLQIRVDCIQSLEKETYDKSCTNPSSPPYLETVRQRLSGIHSVTRLTFRLRRGSNAQLIVPFSDAVGKAPDDSACDTRGLPESLAAASLFSLYFRHDLLSKRKFNKYKWAIGEFPRLPETKKQHYNECMANVDRLYVGTGGKVLNDNKESSPPAREHCKSPTPATPLSCGSTVSFDTGPHHRGSPPPYVACPGEDRLPKATFAAIFVNNSSDGGPPKYANTERLHDVLDPAEGVLPRGNEDITDVQLTPKRKRSFASDHMRSTSSAEALRPEKLQRSLFGDRDSVMMCMFEKLQQQIDQLRQSLGESQGQNEVLGKQNEMLERQNEMLGRQNEVLGRRCDDLEARCSELEHRQDDIVGGIDNLDVEVDELQARCDTFEKEMPDVRGEMEDRREQLVDELKRTMGELIEDRIAKQIGECVDDQLNQVKRRVCEALQPI